MSYNMPKISGIDWEKAHKYLETEEALRGVLEETVRTCNKQISVLSELRCKVLEDATEDNLAAYRIQAHAMKATIRSIGSDLFDMAFALETAGREGDVNKIKESTDEFIVAYRELADKLKTIVGDCDVVRAFDKEEFARELDVIRDSMNAFKVGELQETFKGIASMDVPNEYKALMEKLEHAVRDLASEDVIKCCDEMQSIM